ncbi:MAG: ribose transport system substrate-binding protein [Motiliproteus sp.]|jgi:ribose transport system substrate-binding protein
MRFKRGMPLAIVAVLGLIFLSTAAVQSPAYGKAALPWDGPVEGPSAQPNKTLVYISEDLRNAGVLAVAEGVREAAEIIGWQVHFLDIGGLEGQREAIFNKALALKPDGIILGGGNALANRDLLLRFQQQEIPLVSWHASPFVGPVADTPVLFNVTSDSVAVARQAAEFVIADLARAGVVIFTDSRFSIALKKSEVMAQIIRECLTCTLLSIEDVALNNVALKMPAMTRSLLARYGDRWTHSLGINDLYFDYSVATLVIEGRLPEGPPVNVSAGDGSESAFIRIKNRSYQEATVSEPLLMQGWQLIDELNRFFAGEAFSGYSNPAYLVSGETLDPDQNAQPVFDPDNGYRDHYSRIWKGTPR